MHASFHLSSRLPVTRRRLEQEPAALYTTDGGVDGAERLLRGLFAGSVRCARSSRCMPPPPTICWIIHLSRAVGVTRERSPAHNIEERQRRLLGSMSQRRAKSEKKISSVTHRKSGIKSSRRQSKKKKELSVEGQSLYCCLRNKDRQRPNRAHAHRGRGSFNGPHCLTKASSSSGGKGHESVRVQNTKSSKCVEAVMIDTLGDKAWNEVFFQSSDLLRKF